MGVSDVMLRWVRPLYRLQARHTLCGPCVGNGEHSLCLFWVARRALWKT
jgi:hypothetical protein